jgi:hypothetical protein
VGSLPTTDLYIVAGVDKDGHKSKIHLEDIFLEEEEMRPSERFGPAFAKRIENTLMGYVKVNAWVRDNNVNLPRTCREHLNTFVHSKGFMWLFCSHALPVASP